MTGHALRIDGLGRAYRGVPAVDDATLALMPGEVMALLGPSGCGKSTLLRLIAGLERPDAGTIDGPDGALFGPGIDVPPERRAIGLVFQDHALFPHLDVARNIGFGLAGRPRADRDARVAAMLDTFRIAPLADAYPHRLSGGEQQRVAIARALAPAPAVILMDEPFSGLDGALRRAVQRATLDALRGAGAAVLLVTHDPADAMRHADRVALMRGGRILQIDTPERCYRTPVSIEAAELMGPVVTLPAAFGRGDGAFVRPEAIGFGASGVPAVLIAQAFVGGRWEIELSVAGEALLVHADRPAPAGPLGLSIADDAHQDQLERVKGIEPSS